VNTLGVSPGIYSRYVYASMYIIRTGHIIMVAAIRDCVWLIVIIN